MHSICCVIVYTYITAAAVSTVSPVTAAAVSTVSPVTAAAIAAVQISRATPGKT